MKKLERFILRDAISDGPAGTVYRAEEVLPGDNRRIVALKVLPQIGSGLASGESEEERRFFGEVRVLAQLAVHPHIVTIYAMGVTDGFPWLAMEYTPTTLAQKMTDDPAPPAAVLDMLEQVARGLGAMHALQLPLIHQDLKPANILVDALGHYKVTDFSLATVTAARKTQGLATVRYAAPELLSCDLGHVGPATDLYALGHIAYEMALGARMHRAQFPAVFEGSKEPPPNKWMMWHASMGIKPAAIHEIIHSFPVTLSEMIARLIAKPIEQRYVSAAELLSDMSVLRNEAPAPAQSPRAVAAQVPSGGEMPFAGARGAARPAGTGTPAASSAPIAGAAQYWVRLRGQVTGPFDISTLQRQLKQGSLSRLHQVSADRVTWKQSSEIEGLFGPAVV